MVCCDDCFEALAQQNSKAASCWSQLVKNSEKVAVFAIRNTSKMMNDLEQLGYITTTETLLPCEECKSHQAF